MTFARLTRADWLALAAALALLFVMAADWYSTVQGDEARRIESISQPQGALGGEVEREVRDRAAEQAEGEERNAWQPLALADRLVLLACLAAVGMAITAAFLRAAGRRFDPPMTPSALAAAAAAFGGLLLVYRLVNEPGLDAGTTVKGGAPLGLAALGLLALAAVAALRAEEDGSAFAEPAEEEQAPATPPREEPA